MNVTDAVRVFKETQPALDKVREVKKRNDAAREVLKSHMFAKGITDYKGISMKQVPFRGWDDGKLREFLGDGAEDFRRIMNRTYFNLVKRKSSKPKGGVDRVDDPDLVLSVR